jgi:hypothetical protein
MYLIPEQLIAYDIAAQSFIDLMKQLIPHKLNNETKYTLSS